MAVVHGESKRHCGNALHCTSPRIAFWVGMCIILVWQQAARLLLSDGQCNERCPLSRVGWRSGDVG